MFNNLRIFNWKNDYTSKKGEFEYPTCAYVGEEDWVYFMEPVPTVTSFDVTLSYSKTLLDASGETATPYYSFTQCVTYDNGTSKTFTRTSTYPNAEAVIIWSGSEVNGNVIADSKGIDVSEQTVVANPKITVKLNGVEVTATTTIYQEANAVISTSSRGGETTYDNIVKGIITNATVPASGGTKTATAGNGKQSWSRVDTPYTSYTYTFCTNQTSSKTVNGTSTTVTGTTTISPSVSSISATGSNRGTTTGSTTTLKSQAVTWSGNGGKSCSGTMYVYQQENSSYAEIRITGVDTFMACQECIHPSATATISYTSGKESSTSSGISLYCDGNLSNYGSSFCYDNERGSGQTDRITAKYSIGGKSYYGYSSIISLSDWSC